MEDVLREANVTTYGLDSCIMGEVCYIVPRLWNVSCRWSLQANYHTRDRTQLSCISRKGFESFQDRLKLCILDIWLDYSEKRQAESAWIREKYPDRIPVFLNPIIATTISLKSGFMLPYSDNM
ncbi:uncharacterized protein LOC131240455 [Magnolia sinica]|uniref:uncharacterized protein LOC131240455 n=1 Tax=Magnolia sinica TaxID=86752 RepID=UPI00265837FA|nr:uncharacterized protein LOC131240455 [Magnolia sinica]